MEKLSLSGVGKRPTWPLSVIVIVGLCILGGVLNSSLSYMSSSLSSSSSSDVSSVRGQRLLALSWQLQEYAWSLPESAASVALFIRTARRHAAVSKDDITLCVHVHLCSVSPSSSTPLSSASCVDASKRAVAQLRRLVRRWRGPVSIGVFATHVHAVGDFLRTYDNDGSLQEWASVHVILHRPSGKTQTTTTSLVPGGGGDGGSSMHQGGPPVAETKSEELAVVYPLAQLLNTVTSYASTDYVLVVEAGLHDLSSPLLPPHAASSSSWSPLSPEFVLSPSRHSAYRQLLSREIRAGLLPRHRSVFLIPIVRANALPRRLLAALGIEAIEEGRGRSPVGGGGDGAEGKSDVELEHDDETMLDGLTVEAKKELIHSAQSLSPENLLEQWASQSVAYTANVHSPSTPGAVFTSKPSSPSFRLRGEWLVLRPRTGVVYEEDTTPHTESRSIHSPAPAPRQSRSSSSRSSRSKSYNYHYYRDDDSEADTVRNNRLNRRLVSALHAWDQVCLGARFIILTQGVAVLLSSDPHPAGPLSAARENNVFDGDDDEEISQIAKTVWLSHQAAKQPCLDPRLRSIVDDVDVGGGGRDSGGNGNSSSHSDSSGGEESESESESSSSSSSSAAASEASSAFSSSFSSSVKFEQNAKPEQEQKQQLKQKPKQQLKQKLRRKREHVNEEDALPSSTSSKRKGQTKSRLKSRAESSADE